MVEQRNELPDYEDFELSDGEVQNNGTKKEGVKATTYTGVHSTSFKDMMLIPELQNAITDCGFEHPSEV